MAKKQSSGCRQTLLQACLLCGCVLLLTAPAAQSAEVGLLSFSETPVETGDQVSFEIRMNFGTEQPLAGEFDIVFDASALQYHSFTSSGIGGPPTPVPGNGVLESWSVSSHGGLPSQAVLGTVTFTVINGPCGSALVNAKDSRGAGGGWFDTDFRPINVDYYPAYVTRRSQPAYNNVKQIHIQASQYASRLQVSEVIALSGGVDVATLAGGATATGDGTGPAPGTTGGPAHANNAIDGIGPSAWPDIFFPDTASASEFLTVTLAFPHRLEALSILGSTMATERDIYNVELLDHVGNTIASCTHQSADNPANKAIVNPVPLTILLTPLGSAIAEPGDLLSFEVSMDFTAELTIGGGIDIIYDPTVLRFVSASHSGIGLPQFQTLPVAVDGVLEGWGAGDFDGLPTVALLGVATFEVLDAMCATTALTLRDNSGDVGPWVSLNTFAQQTVIYNQPVLSRQSMPAVDDVKQIRVVSEIPTWLQVSEVVASSNGVDIATSSAGATAAGDGTGSYPGATGGPDHADNAIDGIGPSFWPDIFHPDTDAASEFLQVTLEQPQRIEALSILGRATVNERDIYDVTLMDASGTTLKTCRRQSAVNPLREAVVIASTQADADGDGVADDVDNCQLAGNADQLDSNDDNIGNACDADINNDCVVNFADLGTLKAAFFSEPGTPSWNADTDLTGDSVVNFSDLGVMKSQFFGPPGPSALGCN